MSEDQLNDLVSFVRDGLLDPRVTATLHVGPVARAEWAARAELRSLSVVATCSRVSRKNFRSRLGIMLGAAALLPSAALPFTSHSVQRVSQLRLTRTEIERATDQARDMLMRDHDGYQHRR